MVHNKNDSPRNYSEEPEQPTLGSIGRSVADDIAIGILVKEIHRLESTSLIKARLRQLIDSSDSVLEQYLQELPRLGYAIRLDTPKTRQETMNRLEYLIWMIGMLDPQGHYPSS